MTLPKSIKLLSLPAFILFNFTQIYYQINFVLPYVIEFLKNRIPVTTLENIKSMMYTWTIVSIPIAGIITWLISSAILYGLFKAFRINIKFSSTFLIFGHVYFISAISICLVMFRPEMIYNIIVKGVIPWEFYVEGIVFGILIPLPYLSILYSREVNERIVKVMIPILIILIIGYVVSFVSMIFSRLTSSF